MRTFFIFGFIAVIFESFSQTIPVGFPVYEESLRRQQLLDTSDYQSYAIRPIQVQNNYLINAEDTIHMANELATFINKKADLKLLPVQIQSQFNSHHPYPRYDGSMVPGGGFQFSISPGIYGKVAFFSFQLKPEILHSQNKKYPGFPILTEEEEAIWPNYRKWPNRYKWWNRADIPEQFGEEPLNKIYWGQSFAQVSFGKFAFKASTENLWWGPGKYNSLLMTNNAKGFPHLSLNTISPFKSLLGSFEMQMIAGKLENSGFVPPDTVNNTHLYNPKIDDDRLLNGIALAYQPKWVKGLFVGFISTIQQYSETAKENGRSLPLFSNFIGDQGLAKDTSIWDKKSSVFIRWAMPKSEIYFEYGRNNDSWGWSQLTQTPQTNSAYILGFSKLMALKKTNRYLEFNLELSTLQQPADYIIALNEPDSWYLHETVRHGYTNNGESMGHRAGPGGRMQLLEVNWINNLNKMGFRFERLAHNNDFYYLTHFGSDGGVFWKYWVDYSLSLEINKVYKNVLINLSIQGTKSINYQWQVDPDAPVFEQGTNQDELNLNAFLNLAYLF